MYSIRKFRLDNGLTVLICPSTQVPKVAIQLWYKVGSRDETDGQRGLAHLLEHMVFKGTKVLSESDINLITNKLSGSCNAFTSHDYTGYLFDFPQQHWQVALPLLADCMRNCQFKPDLLNAELKAVIQELKMYNDDYLSTLCERMISAIFRGHAYHHPIIGYKQDLWEITSSKLHAFYQNYYCPNNATLIIVGDVTVEDALEQARLAFDSVPAIPLERPCGVPLFESFVQHELILYRDIQQPLLVFAWTVPGLAEGQSRIIDVASWVLGEGKGSRLYKKLVNEMELASDVQVDICELFDRSILFLHIEPLGLDDLAKIREVVLAEIDALAEHPVAEHELQRALKQSAMENVSIWENYQKIANEIGKFYLATGDHQALLSLNAQEPTAAELTFFFKKYITPTAMHTGKVLPCTANAMQSWCNLQQESDQLDAAILSRKVRESAVESGRYVKKIACKEPQPFSYPSAQKAHLANGLILLWHSRSLISKVEIVLDFKVRSYYDPDHLQGLCNMVFELLLEGTKELPGSRFIEHAEERGITIHSHAGMLSISCLKEDLEFALDLVRQLVTRATLSAERMGHVKTKILADIVNFWDTPYEFATQLVKDYLYKDHPYRKNGLGSAESIERIQQDHVLTFYKQYLSPVGTRLVIVGDLEGIDVAHTVEKALSAWQGPSIVDVPFPTHLSLAKHKLKYPMNRDQVVVCFAGHSVKRFDPLYDPLLLYDQIVTGGVLGSMSSRLFQLREQTGLFYTIGGSFLANAEERPGMMYFKTLVGPDSLQEAQRLILQTLLETKDTLQHEDIELAYNAIINSLVDNFESAEAMAHSFLFMDRYGLAQDYFDTRLEQLKKITVPQIQKAVAHVCNPTRLMCVQIGRLTSLAE